jgi:hypothetical protein
MWNQYLIKGCMRNCKKKVRGDLVKNEYDYVMLKHWNTQDVTAIISFYL